MDKLIERHRLLISKLKTSFRRDLLDEISWQDRLIGIKGARGVGKTTLVLQHIRDTHGISSEALYVNLDDLSFPYKNLVELAEVFAQKGGKFLFIDEVHKQADWIIQLKNIYDFHPELKVVFTGSSVLELDHSKADLSRRAVMYSMQGLSLREFIQIETDAKFEQYSIDEIVEKHEEIAFSILEKVRPLKYFSDYLRYGYYPYYLENASTYSIKLSELINQIIEYDLSYLVKMDAEHYSKMKRFLFLLSRYIPVKPNISNFSAEMGITRGTITKYIHYLKKANVLETLFTSDKKFKGLMKPEKILLHHPNLYYALAREDMNIGSIRETFFVNQLSYRHILEIPKQGDFLVDEKYIVEVGGKAKKYNQIAQLKNAFIAADDIEIGIGNKIPLWLFGFIY